MLVLTRKSNEEIVIGDNIKVRIVRIQGNKVRLGIQAPQELPIVRGELLFDQEFEVELDTLADLDRVA